MRPLAAVHLLCHSIDEVLDDWDVHRGRCAGAMSAPQQAVVPVSSIEVSVVCMQSMTTVRSDQWRGSLMPSTWVGCSTSCLSHDTVGWFCSPCWW